MQPLVRAMPEVMLVSSLLSARPEIQPLLAAMERESLTRQVAMPAFWHVSPTSSRR